jgi:nucleoside-diphosphate-sugar epimerase
VATLKFTIFGSTGFIGSRLAMQLRECGHDVFTPRRKEVVLKSEHLGHVVYAIGMTGNYRQFPLETIDSHVSELVNRINGARYDSWLFLSSTRVYGLSKLHAKEDEKISIVPGLDGIYDISKLLGESICLSQTNPHVRVVRLSNVYGPGQSSNTFLGSLFRSIDDGNDVVIDEDRKSSKDYISIYDVVNMLEKIALTGKSRLYNLASGISTTHEDIAASISNLSGKPVIFSNSLPRRVLASVDISLLRNEFAFEPRTILNDMKSLFDN